MGEIRLRRAGRPEMVAAGLSLLIFAYVAVRAATLCITIDEASTYNCHVTGKWLNILLFTTDGLPDNNHVLHTVLCKLSVQLFGLSELTLRLPALLGCLLYLLGVNRCLRSVVSGWKIVPALLAVGLNPYVVDFLGLARGYGLGLGFTVLGLASLLRAFTETPGKVRPGAARLGILMFGFAALSNLSFLLVLGAGLALVCGFVFIQGVSGRNPAESSAARWPMLLASLILPVVPIIAYLMLPLRLIRELRLFGEGGHDGFWANTVTSLVQGTAYHDRWFWSGIGVAKGWVLLVLLFVPIALFMLWHRDRKKFAVLSVVAAMTFIVALASVVQHHLLGVAFLEGRRGIFLIPLFLLSALALGDPPRTVSRWYAWTAISLGFLVPTLLAVHDLSSLNLRYVYDWGEYGGSRSAMLAVEREIERKPPGRPLKMLANFDFVDVMDFYRAMFGLERVLLPITMDEIDGPADFYYGYFREESEMARYGARPLFRDPGSKTVLYGVTSDPVQP